MLQGIEIDWKNTVLYKISAGLYGPASFLLIFAYIKEGLSNYKKIIKCLFWIIMRYNEKTREKKSN